MTYIPLSTLTEGTRFATESGRVGTLTRHGFSSCGVRWEARTVPTPRGTEAEPACHADIAPGTQVVHVGGPQPEDGNAND